jgi:outer membrane murein-binding lipoprotein Lpp
LLAVIAEQELIENIAPIQLGIRLLIPAGSRLLELAEMRRYAGAFDPGSLFHPWKHDDARVDALAEGVQQLAATGDKLAWTRSETFARVWQAAGHAEAQAAEGRADQAAMGGSASVFTPLGQQPMFAARPAIPHFTEPWYCCAEPTREQFISIGGGAPPAARRERQADTGLQADAFL